MKKSLLGLAVAASILGGCSLPPDYERPIPPVNARYPQGQAYPPKENADVVAADQGWRQIFKDPTLQQLILTSLEHNRDLKVAALNIEAYQAQYQIQRNSLFPSVSADTGLTRQRTPTDLSQTGRSDISSQYSVKLGISSYELDLFGRVRSLNQKALETYLSSEDTLRSTQISLVASVANAYFTWQADEALLKLTEDTVAAYAQSRDLTQRSCDVGTSSALDLAQARSLVESARVSLATYQRQVAQDRNMLGTHLPDYLPSGKPLDGDLIGKVPAGLPSDLLTRRPDILEAEHTLKASNANIGASRAAFFPSISLTANAGTSSAELSGLFKGGSGSWLFSPNISLPIFNAGNLRASLDYSKIQKDISIAKYEKSIQTAFQEVSDGLASRKTYVEQLQAQRDDVHSNQQYRDLAEYRYRVGIDSNLTFLDAQRSLFNAQQSLIRDRLSQLTSEVNLYKALRGGWIENTGPAHATQNADVNTISQLSIGLRSS